MSLPAGRELDAELWTLLGHCPHLETERFCEEGDGYTWFSYECKHCGEEICGDNQLPELSTSYQGMGTLIEEMRGRGLEEMRGRGLYVDITTYADFFEVRIRRSDGSAVSDASVQSLPHAVALAARAALKGESA